MPRALPAQLAAAMDSGSFKVYVAIGKRNHPGYTTLTTNILYYKYNGLNLTVKYASPNLPEDDGLIVGDKYYLERGVTIAGVNYTIKSASLRFDDYEINRQIITAKFSLFSAGEKPQAVPGDDTYTNVLTALNPNPGTIDFLPTPENPNHWSYRFFPAGKQVSLKSYAALLPLIRQKYLLQVVDNSDDSNEDEIQFFHLRSPTALGDWTLGESNMGGVSVCYSPSLNLFLAVDAQFPTGHIYTSTGGIDWTQTNSPAGTQYTAAWIDELGLFLIGGGLFGGGSKRLYTSPDGATWTGRDTANTNDYIRGFAYSPSLGRLVLVTNLFGSTHNIQTSPDGITWTERTTTGTPQFYAVAWSPEQNIFVAAGTQIHSSPDGITWTQRSITGTFYGVCWSPELALFVAVGDSGLAHTSPDGINWTAQTAPIRDWKAIAWSPSLGLFTAIANSGTGNRSMTSPDGITWTSKPTPADNAYQGLVWAEELGIFVAVSYYYSNMHAGNVTQSADHTIQQGDITLLKDGASQAFLWRDELAAIHTNGTETSLIHNLGYLESTDQPPASLRNSDRASVTVGIHLKYKTGDIFSLQINASQTATYLAEVTEILDPDAEIGWRCEISLIERFSNTNAGPMPGTIERVAAYTPLVTTNFNGNLDATVNNLQALAEKIDDLALSGGTWGSITGSLPDQTDLQAQLNARLTDAPSDGNQYIRKNAAWQILTGGGGTWGSITGTLSNQSDLQAALDAKAAASHQHTARIPYIHHGQSNTVPASTTRYIVPAIPAITTLNAVPWPVPGIIRNLYVRVNTIQPASGRMEFTIQKDLVDTSVKVIIPASTAAGTTIFDVTNTVTFVGGELFCIKVQNFATAAGSAILGVTWEFQPGTT